jgi:hypothetical protein
MSRDVSWVMPKSRFTENGNGLTVLDTSDRKLRDDGDKQCIKHQISTFTPFA